ncbi:MAG: acylneuraminate cytidylyltransferase family protein [Patescibacteria group bacterium]
MKIVAIIPARGGSKRIPKKNIYPFCGKPLLAWTVIAALKSEVFTDVYVSTDAQDIAAVALEYGAKVIMRKRGNDDQTIVSLATIYSLQQIEQEQGEKYDIVFQLMANCPLRDADDIRHAATHFDISGTDFQLSCFSYDYANPWWALKIADRYSGQALHPEALKTRSQDLDTLYCPTGAIWAAKVPHLYEAGTFYGPNYTLVPMKKSSHAVDIDEMEDLIFAEALKTVERRVADERNGKPNN